MARPATRACYQDLRGQLQPAGTFSSKKDADKAWQKAEVRLAEGRLGDPRRGRRPSAATSPRSGCPTM